MDGLRQKARRRVSRNDDWSEFTSLEHGGVRIHGQATGVSAGGVASATVFENDRLDALRETFLRGSRCVLCPGRRQNRQQRGNTGYDQQTPPAHFLLLRFQNRAACLFVEGMRNTTEP